MRLTIKMWLVLFIIVLVGLFINCFAVIDDIKIGSFTLTADILKAAVNLLLQILIIFLFVPVHGTTKRGLKQLKSALDGMANGNLGIHIYIDKSTSIGNVVKSFNRMSDAVQNSFDKLSQINLAYQRFVPNQLFRCLNRQSVLEMTPGDYNHKKASILCMNMRKYHLLTESLTDSQAFHFLNNFLDKMVNIVNSQDGFVKDYDRAGFNAIFSDHTDNAVLAALLFAETSTELSKQLNTEDKNDKKISISTAIIYGKIIWGVVGEKNRLDISVVSDHLRIVSTLERLAYRFSSNIIVTRDAFDRLVNPQLYRYRYLGEIIFKDLDAKVNIYDFFDGDPAALRNGKEVTLDNFNTGVDFFYKQEFTQARKFFIRVLQKFPDDKVSRKYLRLCNEGNGQQVLETV